MKRFFAYADPYLRQIAAQVQRSRTVPLPGTGIETVLRG